MPSSFRPCKFNNTLNCVYLSIDFIYYFGLYQNAISGAVHLLRILMGIGAHDTDWALGPREGKSGLGYKLSVPCLLIRTDVLYFIAVLQGVTDEESFLLFFSPS